MRAVTRNRPPLEQPVHVADGLALRGLHFVHQPATVPLVVSASVGRSGLVLCASVQRAPDVVGPWEVLRGIPRAVDPGASAAVVDGESVQLVPLVALRARGEQKACRTPSGTCSVSCCSDGTVGAPTSSEARNSSGPSPALPENRSACTLRPGAANCEVPSTTRAARPATFDGPVLVQVRAHGHGQRRPRQLRTSCLSQVPARTCARRCWSLVTTYGISSGLRTSTVAVAPSSPSPQGLMELASAPRRVRSA